MVKMHINIDCNFIVIFAQILCFYAKKKKKKKSNTCNNVLDIAKNMPRVH